MTRASHQRIAKRIAKRAAKFDDPPAFVKPPPGMLSEQVDLDDFRLVLGLIHPEGSPLMVAAWDGQNLRRLLPEQASRWADELAADANAEALAPAIEAIRAKVRRVGDIVSAAIMREHECEGRA